MTIEEAKLIVRKKYQSSGSFINTKPLSEEEEKEAKAAMDFILDEIFSPKAKKGRKFLNQDERTHPL